MPCVKLPVGCRFMPLCSTYACSLLRQPVASLYSAAPSELHAGPPDASGCAVVVHAGACHDSPALKNQYVHFVLC